jgi:hypothetical protein
MFVNMIIAIRSQDYIQTYSTRFAHVKIQKLGETVAAAAAAAATT